MQKENLIIALKKFQLRVKDQNVFIKPNINSQFINQILIQHDVKDCEVLLQVNSADSEAKKTALVLTEAKLIYLDSSLSYNCIDLSKIQSIVLEDTTLVLNKSYNISLSNISNAVMKPLFDLLKTITEEWTLTKNHHSTVHAAEVALKPTQVVATESEDAEFLDSLKVIAGKNVGAETKGSATHVTEIPQNPIQPIENENVEFFDLLYDTTFTKFLTLKLTRVFYIIILVLFTIFAGAGLLYLASIFLFENKSAPPEQTVILVIYGFLYMLLCVFLTVFARIFLEGIIVLFRIAENTSLIASWLKSKNNS